MISRKWYLLIAPFLIGSSLLVSSCSSDDDNGPSQEEMIEQMLSEVRQLTTGLQTMEAAAAAGWDTDLSGCVEHPVEGGMGHHIARMEYIDGRVNHLEPQILLFEPQADGTFELVGVEYIVPFAILPADEDPPELFFHPFHHNHQQGIWALHVWTEKENPSGVFYDWNPNVSCEHAPPTQEELIEQMLTEVRELTAGLQTMEAADAAGWDTDLSGCVEHPEEGGMGHHIARMEYIDGRVNHLEPQILLFEPHADGSFELVGVEYIVPFAIHPADEDPPELFFHSFHQNHQQEIWALHVWTEKENPSGTFYDWNPNVSCN